MSAIEGFNPASILANLKSHPDISSGLTYVFTELRNLAAEAGALEGEAVAIAKPGLQKLHAFLADPAPVVDALLHGTKAKETEPTEKPVSQNPGSAGGNVYGSELGDNGKGIPGTSGGASDNTGAKVPETDVQGGKPARTGREGDPTGNDGALTGAPPALKEGDTKADPEKSIVNDPANKTAPSDPAAAASGLSVGSQSFGQDAPPGQSVAAKLGESIEAKNEAKKDGDPSAA